jgi:uracil-DNA glycosylase
MLEKIVGEKWSKELEPYLDKEYFKELGNFLATEYDTHNVYPVRGDIFNAFKFTEYQDINVIIIGLDPYIRHGQAYGISFGVRDSCLLIPASLRNISKEVENDVYDGLQLSFDYTLQSWCEQGCFMYNTALTVVEGKTGSHLKQWAPFTKAVIDSLNNKEFCVYILLGKVAQDYEKYIDKKEGIHIVKAPHPSAESYAGGKAGFFGSGIFSQVNKILLDNNKEQIKW